MTRILLAALAVLLSGHVNAADYRHGPYAGVTLGYATGSLTNNTGDLTTDGVPVSGIVGYTHAIAGGLGVGVELEGVWNNVKGSQTDRGFTLEASTDWTAALKARIGYAAGPALIYATAGPSWSKGKIELLGLKDTSTNLGILAGAGVDLQLTETIAMRLEAVRQFSSGQEWTLGTASTKLDAGETTLRAGVIFNLN